MSLASFVRNYALNCYTFEGDKEDYLVARLIYKYMRGHRVLDLGCGPVATVLSVFYPEAKKVVAVDRLQENLNFIKKHSAELAPLIARAKNYKQRYLGKKGNVPTMRLVKGDVTKRLPLGTFDSVMQIGAFGALDSAEQFQTAVNHAYRYLKPGGTLLMVNWVGNVKRPHHFNGKVDELTIFKPSLQQAGFRIIELHTTSSLGASKKNGYKKIIWAVAEK